MAEMWGRFSGHRGVTEWAVGRAGARAEVGVVRALRGASPSSGSPRACGLGAFRAYAGVGAG